jgi:disulfide bond formation protein DsbB/cytochrome c5
MVTEKDLDGVALMTRVSDWLNRNSLYIALLAAWIAMSGSLYFSEVKGYIPCVLCWYQRILMYPLTLILAVGLLRRDRHLPYYVLPLSVFGLGMSSYHYLLEKTDIFDATAPCRQGVSCTTQWINWWGFATIPFLALVGFLIITIMSITALVNHEPVGEDEDGDPLRTPWLRVIAPILTVLAVFAVLFITGRPQTAVATNSEGTPASAHAGHTAMNPNAPTVLASGDKLYREACAACHGLDAKGVTNLGKPLVGSEFLASNSDKQVLAVIKEGRDLSSPLNTTGLVMPPNGGRPDLNDDDLLSIIAYLRAQS